MLWWVVSVALPAMCVFSSGTLERHRQGGGRDVAFAEPKDARGLGPAGFRACLLCRAGMFLGGRRRPPERPDRSVSVPVSVRTRRGPPSAPSSYHTVALHPTAPWTSSDR